MDLKFKKDMLKLMINEDAEMTNFTDTRITDDLSGRYININGRGFDIYDNNGEPIAKDVSLEFDHATGEYILNIDTDYNAIYGFGERFNGVNQKGMCPEIKIVEKFCYQGEFTYMPIPFCWTDKGLGIYIETETISKFDLNDGIQITLKANSKGEWPAIYFMFGKPKEILSIYSDLTGKPKLPPKWAFGVWISANRWNTQDEVERQIKLCEKNQFPVNVVVIEAWSDEATFYIWNDAKYKPKDDVEKFKYSDFMFPEDGKWPDPYMLIESLHKKGVKLILWQIPVLKKLEPGRKNRQHEIDCDYASKNKLCVLNKDGSDYIIPQGHWFEGSMIPDFTNNHTKKWWFDKRKYLLDMGVDGFKTDGGEFIYCKDVMFANGKTGREMKNGYAASYVRTYTEFVGNNRVLFSRAGYTGQQKCPMQWGGDQKSTWDEFKNIIKAGLSASLSGVPFWGFDIAGFAGALPSKDLYLRSTQTAVFTPVMQWHSEPVGGQFKNIMPSADGNNDRSPWNIAKYYKDPQLIDRLRFHYNLRMNLIPYIYNEAIRSSEIGIPLMKHLAVDYFFDSNCISIEDEFMLGDMLVAPILEEGANGRKVYLPNDVWIDLWTGKTVEGGCGIYVETGIDRIPVFIRRGSAIALNLNDSLKLGSKVGNRMDGYTNLCLYLTGLFGKYHFIDDLGNEFILKWKNGKTDIDYIKGNVEIKTVFIDK